MGTSINSFKLYTEFLANKNQVGNSLTITQFNQVANQAQMQLFEKDYQTFKRDRVTSEYLKTFLVNRTTSVPLTGRLNYPSDLEHTASIGSYYGPPTGSPYETPVVEVDDNEFRDIMRSQLMTPTKEFPKFLETATDYRFLPQNIGVVMIDYFRTPVIPIWGYTVVAGRPVYDPTTSTNFEWTDFSMNNVAAMFLSLIGVNLKDSELSQFSELYKQQTNSVQ